MALSFDKLTAAIQDLTTATEVLITAITAGNPADQAKIDALTEQVNTLKAQVVAEAPPAA